MMESPSEIEDNTSTILSMKSRRFLNKNDAWRFLIIKRMSMDPMMERIPEEAEMALYVEEIFFPSQRSHLPQLLISLIIVLLRRFLFFETKNEIVNL